MGWIGLDGVGWGGSNGVKGVEMMTGGFCKGC